ncbi:hypothetical protein E2562_035168 [Oryza meyeriana var. granulata]|uniref:Uncharacterized protein n=1 Tax=Oryza meyeriana var. granulata TaxID=110450 RepID=A0A6G1E6W5_9ORYZ|nr:hypothetical protein E2562_035168 [Oryza meyeriana var. granulata]
MGELGAVVAEEGCRHQIWSDQKQGGAEVEANVAKKLALRSSLPSNAPLRGHHRHKLLPADDIAAMNCSVLMSSPPRTTPLCQATPPRGSGEFKIRSDEVDRVTGYGDGAGSGKLMMTQAEEEEATTSSR